MTKEQLEKMAERYEKKADRNYMYYQSTGIARYDYQYRQACDIAETARQALSAADDHEKCGYLKAEILQLGDKVQCIQYLPDAARDEARESILRDLLALATMEGLRKDEKL